MLEYKIDEEKEITNFFCKSINNVYMWELWLYCEDPQCFENQKKKQRDEKMHFELLSRGFVLSLQLKVQTTSKITQVLIALRFGTHWRIHVHLEKNFMKKQLSAPNKSPKPRFSTVQKIKFEMFLNIGGSVKNHHETIAYFDWFLRC